MSRDKIKVLHIITRWLKSGGAERNTYFTIKGLAQEKYNIDLAIGGDSETIPEDLGVKIIKINSLKRNICPISDLLAFFQLYRVIKKNKYDLVQTHQSKAGFLGRVAARLAGVSVIVHTLHGQLFYERQNQLLKWFYTVLEKFCAKFTDHFISVGKDIRDYYLKYRVGKKENYSIIRSWIDLEKFRQAAEMSQEEKKKIKQGFAISSDEPVVGIIGRLERSKGWEEAIEVAKLVAKKQPKVKFLFVGKGSFQKELEKKVVEVKPQPTVKFVGYREEIEKVMAIFNVLLSTSKREGLSQVMVQAAAMGKPMVAFDVLGAGEMIKDNGFIVPQKDIKGMAEKIDYLLLDLQKAKAIGERGKELVSNEWKFDEIKQKNNRLYKELLLRCLQ